MKIENDGPNVTISELTELTAVNSGQFRDRVGAVLPAAPSLIEIDLSQTQFVDSSGLGALFALYRSAGDGKGARLRLVNPGPEIQQLFELTQMHQLFEIVQR
ncbi:MAG: STAS domain-containing protein [Opitutaceae bacterium]